MGSGQSQCRLVEATLSFVKEFKFASEIELPRDPLPSEGGPAGKKKVKGVTVEELRKASFNQEAFVPEFLYDAMKENKRFDSMQVGRRIHRLENLADSPRELERTPRRRRRIPRVLPRHSS